VIDRRSARADNGNGCARGQKGAPVVVVERLGALVVIMVVS
jgi:hypothetical protein